jgi:hypothetical protein
MMLLIWTVASLAAVAAAFYTNRIRWYVAVPLVVAVMLCSMAAQAAQADTRVRWSMPTPGCYRSSVTEYRNGVTQGLLGPLWTMNQRLNWCQIAPGATVWSGPTVHRSHTVNGFWIWDGYVAKTRVKRLDNPRRWQVYVKGSFNSAPDVFGVTEHNYPWIRMTIWKANPGHATWAARCGC